MSLFPKIERVCPYLDRLDEAMDGDFCRMCKRTVHDLTDMSDPERAAFLTACGGDACVSYIAYVRPAVAAALVAASAAVLVVPEAAMAQQRHKVRPAHAVRVLPPPPLVPVMLGGAPPPMPVPEKPTPPEQPPAQAAIKPD